jgi:hypothetical protein
MLTEIPLAQILYLNCFLQIFTNLYPKLVGTLLVAQLVEALRYKAEVRGFHSRRCHCHSPSGRTVSPVLTEPLIGMSTRNISWEVKAVAVQG